MSCHESPRQVELAKKADNVNVKAVYLGIAPLRSLIKSGSFYKLAFHFRLDSSGYLYPVAEYTSTTADQSTELQSILETNPSTSTLHLPVELPDERYNLIGTGGLNNQISQLLADASIAYLRIDLINYPREQRFIRFNITKCLSTTDPAISPTSSLYYIDPIPPGTRY